MIVSLNDLSAEERALLVALPYRVGLWISQSDTTGGEEADDAEMQALETIVIAFVEDFCKSSFVEELMRETLAQKEAWESWQENIGGIPAECTQAVDVLREKMLMKDVTSFKHNLMEIGVDVAMAFCEVDIQQSLADRIRIYSRYYTQMIKARLGRGQKPNLGEIMNISPKEERALTALKEALRYDVEEGLVFVVADEDGAGTGVEERVDVETESDANAEEEDAVKVAVKGD